MSAAGDTRRPHVTYVVVNWNQRQLTLDCLSSLREQRYPSFEVVLVDNGSVDGSAEAVEEAFPAVTVIRNGANLGIAGANNVGIRRALATDTDYVFLLNNDTLVDPDMLAHLADAAEAEVDIGIAGPTMLYFDPPETIWCAGNGIDWRDGSTERLLDGMPLSAVEHAGIEDVDFITSCAACIKRRVFDDVGLMDERYFIYYDETDWFARAASAGWRSVHVPWAHMWHKVSATMRPASPATTYYMVRNRVLFINKHFHGWRRMAALTRVLAAETRTILAHSVKPEHRPLRTSRTARVLALRDAARGRFGPMGEDVAVLCAEAGR